MRVQIALDAGRGEYIHEHAKNHYVHRDVKTSNILLDGSFRAKILVWQACWKNRRRRSHSHKSCWDVWLLGSGVRFQTFMWPLCPYLVSCVLILLVVLGT